MTEINETRAQTTSRPSRIRRHIAVTLAALAIATGSLGAIDPTPASAASGVATSRGFVCGPNRWVRNNFPNMTAIGGGIESVYFASALYKWTGSQWTHVATLGYYSGASNANGNLSLGSLAGMSYSWVQGMGAVFAAGPIFNNLSAGYYRTAEYYQWQNGAKASLWSKVTNSTADWCYVS